MKDINKFFANLFVNLVGAVTIVLAVLYGIAAIVGLFTVPLLQALPIIIVLPLTFILFLGPLNMMAHWYSASLDHYSKSKEK